MSTSIPVLNRNTQLPPLLLPAAWPAERCDPFGKRRRQVHLEGDGLEGLAFVATKRARLAVLEATPRTSSASASGSGSVSGSVSASPAAASPVPVSPAAGPTPSPTPVAVPVSPRSERASPRRDSSAGRSSKRQRIGPSCDGCRLKKIKCDARVEVLYQGGAVTRLFSDRLHMVVSREQVLAHLPFLDIPSANSDDSSDDSGDDSHSHSHSHSFLVKHIDKIVLFRPCTSCAKRRASVEGLDPHPPVVSSPMEDHPAGGCVFSKGFTRADINVFAKITKRGGPRAVQEMTLQDYRDAGFE